MYRGADIADALEIKCPTVCVKLKRLTEIRDISMEEHHCIHLTGQGLKIEESTLDKHGLLLALLQNLCVPSTITRKDACAIEHNLSPETYRALKHLLSKRQDNI